HRGDGLPAPRRAAAARMCPLRQPLRRPGVRASRRDTAHRSRRGRTRCVRIAMNHIMMSPDWRPPTLETERLVLRPFTEADAPALFVHASNPTVTRFTPWAHHQSL